jgi:hypothetical protein
VLLAGGRCKILADQGGEAPGEQGLQLSGDFCCRWRDEGYPKLLVIAGAALPRGSVTLTLHPLAQQLAIAANRFGSFAGSPFRRFLVVAPQLHFSEHPLALHFLLQGSQSLIDVVVANEDLHGGDSPLLVIGNGGRRYGRSALLF